MGAKRFLVIYRDEGDRHDGEVDGRFSSKAEAVKFIEGKNAEEDADDYSGNFSWTYEIAEVVAMFVTSCKVNRSFSTREVKP
jgi:hypothetical protein